VVRESGGRAELLPATDCLRDRGHARQGFGESLRGQRLRAVGKCALRVRMDLDQEAVGAAGALMANGDVVTPPHNRKTDASFSFEEA
jgi:hypothetical protein